MAMVLFDNNQHCNPQVDLLFRHFTLVGKHQIICNNLENNSFRASYQLTIDKKFLLVEWECSFVCRRSLLLGAL